MFDFLVKIPPPTPRFHDVFEQLHPVSPGASNSRTGRRYVEALGNSMSMDLIHSHEVRGKPGTPTTHDLRKTFYSKCSIQKAKTVIERFGANSRRIG